MNITKISIERPTLVVVVFSVLAFLGVLSYLYLSYELTPKFTPPISAITTIYPGASPREVENSITRPIEDAISSLENVDRISSVSQENISVVRFEMEVGADVDKGLLEAQRKVNTILDQLPVNIQGPNLSRFDFDDLPVLRLGAFSDLAESDFFDLARTQLQPELSQIEGVAQIRLLGGQEREIRVSVDPQKLKVYGLSILHIIKAINLSNLDFPAGRLMNQDNQVFIRLAGKLRTLKDLEDLIISKTPGGSVVKLKNVALVEDHTQDPEIISRTNGRNSLGIDIKKQSDANAVDMSRMVKQRLAELEKEHQAIGLRFELAQDSSQFTLKAANEVMEDLLLAVILVSLIMLLFLHSLRNALIVFVSIPTSIITTFIVVYWLGYSLNLMTLLGLSLAIGILVDDSIVVIENIYRHVRMGKSRAQAAFDGRMEIGYTALSITLIDVVVFLPIVFAEGMVADLFRQFSVVIVTSTLISLLVSFTLVPLLASRFAKQEHGQSKSSYGKLVVYFEKLLDWLINKIVKAVNWGFKYPSGVLWGALILFGLAISLIPFGFIGSEFTSAGDRGEFILEVELPEEATLAQTDDAARRVEQYLKTIPEVASVFTTVGITSSGRIEFNTANLAEVSVQLIEKNQRDFSTTYLTRKIKLDLEGQLPGVRIKPVELNLVGLRNDGAVEVTFTGTHLESLEVFADQIKEVLDSIPGTVEVFASSQGGRPELEVEVDREKMAGLGLTVSAVGSVLRTAFQGNNKAQLRLGEYDYQINVLLDPAFRRHTNDIGNLTVINDQGQLIPVKQFARVKETISPANLERTDRIPSVTLKSQVIGRPAGTVGNELKSMLSETDIPPGIKYKFGGQTKRQQEGFATLTVVLITSILFVYLIMVALYNSYFYPFVVLFSIPLALIGALLALALAKQTLSIFSIMGLIMLVGLVGKNAILVVDFTNRLKEDGMEIKAALLKATRLRFRPVLMTNLTMVFGLLPIALAGGAGSEWKNGLAWALIGGLSSSMVLSLVVVPVVYHFLDQKFRALGLIRTREVETISQEKDAAIGVAQ